MLLALALTLAIAAAASPATSALPVPGTVTPDIARRLDADLSRLAGTASGQSPALAVAIVEHGRLVYDRGFGKAKADTRFRIGSITNMFTAVSIMQLVQQHRVDLDATVADYLPGAPHAKEITIRQLLQHTSGLWNYGDQALDSGTFAKPTTPQRILALAAQHPLFTPPGETYAYSSTGYVILGLVVERVSGEPLATYERRHILDRAGMHETTFGVAAPNAPMATGYLSASGQVAPAFDPSWLFADGDVVSTAGDLARFDIALLGGSLVSRKTFALMQAEPVNGDGLSHGLGVDLFVLRGSSYLGHRGEVPGFESDDEMIASAGFATVVLSDSFEFPTTRANRVIRTILLPGSDVSATAEDRAVTERFIKTLSGLMRGEADRGQLTETVDEALTPEVLAQTAGELKPLGTIVRTTFLGSEKAAGATVYSYDVTFSGGQTMTWQFSLAPDGKIAGIGTRG